MHRSGILCGNSHQIGTPLREMSLMDLHDTCNKSVPVYILAGFKPLILRMVLHNYIYRRWFRPYRSEIEWDQFFCRFTVVWGFPKEARLSHSTTAPLIQLNKDMCAATDKARLKYDKILETGESHRYYSQPALEQTKFYILQPLFKAIMILVSSWDYQLEDSGSISTLPTYLVLTGITDGLSAPITFESISDKIDTDVCDSPGTVRTTLETAVDFVKALEAREEAAFGLKPDPVASWPSFSLLTMSEEMKLAGPSSRFVDTNRFPHWGDDRSNLRQ
ncbi:hypothetical protein F4778DRAFT_770881 [Xylariomycetidae sp. FL2044]|nr:hypothetical protein F4778DRAFT_770881 [Xylariomycetidae sp. FL2044]